MENENNTNRSFKTAVWAVLLLAATVWTMGYLSVVYAAAAWAFSGFAFGEALGDAWEAWPQLAAAAGLVLASRTSLVRRHRRQERDRLRRRGQLIS